MKDRFLYWFLAISPSSYHLHIKMNIQQPPTHFSISKKKYEKHIIIAKVIIIFVIHTNTRKKNMSYFIKFSFKKKFKRKFRWLSMKVKREKNNFLRKFSFIFLGLTNRLRFIHRCCRRRQVFFFHIFFLSHSINIERNLCEGARVKFETFFTSAQNSKDILYSFYHPPEKPHL